MTEILTFAGDHPIVAVLVAWSIASILKMPFWALNRFFRSRNIANWCDAATADGSALYYNQNYFDFWKPTTALPSTVLDIPSTDGKSP